MKNKKLNCSVTSKEALFFRASIVAIVLFFSLLICYLMSINIGIQGDGNEYVLQTVAFHNHLTFGIDTDDLEQAKAEFYNNQDSLQATFNSIIHDDQGRGYSNHFGAYSVLVMLVKTVLLKIGIYPLWAFSVTNYLLWLAAVLVIFFCLKTDSIKKFCIILLIMLNPAFFYVDWVHTEIYIFAFEVIGLVFLYNKWHALSILAISFAAMQNVGVLPVGMIVGLDYIFTCIDKYKVDENLNTIMGFVRLYWKKIILHGFLYLPAFLPMIMTYIRFGTFNLVAKVAMENKYTLHKAFDYIFDLNLGVFPYEPLILCLFIMLIIGGIRKYPRAALLNVTGVIGILYIISHQRQINSGMQEIMRYCIWIIPVLIFFVILAWDYTSNKNKNVWIVRVSIVEAIYTVLLISYCVWWGGGYNIGEFAPWTKVVLDKVPQIYNPTHGIFYSRTQGGELYYSASPVVYFNEEGYIRKILLSKEAEQQFYSDDFILYDSEGNFIDKRDLQVRTVDGGDFKYVNFMGEVNYTSPYQLGEMISFQAESNTASPYIENGVSFSEQWGSWTNGDVVTMNFWVEEDAQLVYGYIDVGGTYYQPQHTTVVINNQVVYNETIEGDEDIDFIFVKPDTNILEMKIFLPDSVSPYEIMNAQDGRDLALALFSMSFNEIETEGVSLEKNGTIYFGSDSYNADKYVLHGISFREDIFSWTDGNKVDICFASEDYMGEKLSCKVNLKGVFNEKQTVSITVNGEEVYERVVLDGKQTIEFDTGIIQEPNTVISLILPDAISPSELGMSSDQRKLALMVEDIVINPY